MSDSPGPFGGWFATIGSFIGMYLGWDLTHHWGGVLVGLIVFGYVGLFVEHVVYAVLMTAIAVAIIMIRHGIMQAIIHGISNSGG